MHSEHLRAALASLQGEVTLSPGLGGQGLLGQALR